MGTYGISKTIDVFRAISRVKSRFRLSWIFGIVDRIDGLDRFGRSYGWITARRMRLITSGQTTSLLNMTGRWIVSCKSHCRT